MLIYNNDKLAIYKSQFVVLKIIHIHVPSLIMFNNINSANYDSFNYIQ
jgi:hypothetical protein